MNELFDVMTAAEVAAEFGITERNVRKTCEDGRVKARKAGGTWLISRPDVYRHWGLPESHANNEQEPVFFLTIDDRIIAAFRDSGAAKEHVETSYANEHATFSWRQEGDDWYGVIYHETDNAAALFDKEAPLKVEVERHVRIKRGVLV